MNWPTSERRRQQKLAWLKCKYEQIKQINKCYKQMRRCEWRAWNTNPWKPRKPERKGKENTTHAANLAAYTQMQNYIWPLFLSSGVYVSQNQNPERKLTKKTDRNTFSKEPDWSRTAWGGRGLQSPPTFQVPKRNDSRLPAADAKSHSVDEFKLFRTECVHYNQKGAACTYIHMYINMCILAKIKPLEFHNRFSSAQLCRVFLILIE